MSDAYKIFKQLQEKEKEAQRYKSYEKEDLIDEILELQEREEQLQNNWNELKSWGEKKIENANKYLNDPNENWDEDARGYVLVRKFQLEEMLKQMQELEGKQCHTTLE